MQSKRDNQVRLDFWWEKVISSIENRKLVLESRVTT